jgi:hypothetical protein
MRKAPVLIVVFLAALTAGCVMSGKPGKPAVVTPVTPNPVSTTPPPPPSQPLSIPQTQVELPKPQPIADAALPADPAPAIDLPADTATGTRTGQGRGTQIRPGTPQRTDTAQPSNSGANPGANPGTNPAANPVVAPPPAATPAEPPAPTLQEVVSQAELTRYQVQAQGKAREAQQIFDQYSKRPKLTPAQEEVLSQIKSFIESSQAAEKRGDMKTADALAERAQIKARDLVNGR